MNNILAERIQAANAAKEKALARLKAANNALVLVGKSEVSLPEVYVQNSGHLPVYLVIDVSPSMSGSPIAAVNEGLKIFQSVIREDPKCQKTVLVSVIEFSDSANQTVSLTKANEFIAPRVTAGGYGTALSSALRVLNGALATSKPTDYKPMVFLMTDGQPNWGDPWEAEYHRIPNRQRPGLFVAIGAGDANQTVLRKLAPEHTYMMSDMSQAKIRELFKWIGGSVAKVAQAPKKPSQSSYQMSSGLLLPPANLFRGTCRTMETR